MRSLAQPTYSLFADDLASVTRRSRDAWEALRGQRIFVTGGTGFFGKWLLETFAYANDELELQAEMVVLTRDARRFVQSLPHLGECSSIRFLAGDVRTFAFPRGEFSHVIHAAADASAQLNADAPLTMFDVIVAGTRRVLEFSAASGAQKMLLISSGAVYGRQPAGMRLIAEDYSGGPDPMSSAAAYGEGKRVAELLSAAASRRDGLHVAIARCFAFVGPYLPLDRHFAIGNFLRDALDRQPVVVRGDGQSQRSYMYAADLAAWLWTILHRGENCRPYNVGSDQPHSVLETARAVAALPTDPLPVRVEGISNPTLAASTYVPSIERARSELNLEIKTDFPSAISRTFSWLKQNNHSLETEIR